MTREVYVYVCGRMPVFRTFSQTGGALLRKINWVPEKEGKFFQKQSHRNIHLGNENKKLLGLKLFYFFLFLEIFRTEKDLDFWVCNLSFSFLCIVFRND